MSNMLSYIYKGHNLKIFHENKVHHVRESLTEMDLAMKFQTPILKHFYPLESDVISGQNLENGEGLRELKAKLEDRKITFSPHVVHFDGINLENLENIKEKTHVKIEYNEDT